jgi:hypothetical protein
MAIRIWRELCSHPNIHMVNMEARTFSPGTLRHLTFHPHCYPTLDIQRQETSVVDISFDDVNFTDTIPT